MKGLDLAENFYYEKIAPLISEKFPSDEKNIAAGLVGEGSECFGFDDEISRDHDWGAGLCLWLNDKDYSVIGESLKEAYSKMPDHFSGFPVRKPLGLNGHRIGVIRIKDFFKSLIGIDYPPQTIEEWKKIPEYSLAAATNGKIFNDPKGEFTKFYTNLRNYYPEDLRLKRIASGCMRMAQSGQYNYIRCVARGEDVAALFALTYFMEESIKMAFLLNRRFRPFYKWMPRAVKSLPLLGTEIHSLLERILAIEKETNDAREIFALIEVISALIADCLKKEGLSESKSSFLLDHGLSVQKKIGDISLRYGNMMED